MKTFKKNLWFSDVLEGTKKVHCKEMRSECGICSDLIFISSASFLEIKIECELLLSFLFSSRRCIQSPVTYLRQGTFGENG